MLRSERARVVRELARSRWKTNRSRRQELTRNGYRLVLTAEPGYVHDNAGEVVGVDAWVELYGPDGQEIPIDPHRRIVNPPTQPRRGGGAEWALYEALWDTVTATPAPHGWRTSGTVTAIYGETTDGRVEGQSATYTAARQGTGNLSVDTTGVTSATGQFFSSTYSCYQQFWAFNTAAIPATDVVTAVDLALYETGQDLTGGHFVVEARAFDWGTSLTTTDFRPGATLSAYTLLASINTTGMGTLNQYYTLTSEAAFLAVPNLKTGTVRLFTSSSKQRLNQTPSGREYVQFATSDASGTTTDPRLTITHSAPPFTGWGVPV